MQVTEFWVKRRQLREGKVVQLEAEPLREGEVRLAIDKFALTANNISYAVSGEMIGYWKFFPAEGEWGKVTVWGFADVVESRCAGLPVGERIWGFFPMSSHVTLLPGKLAPGQFTDFAPHRKALPALYNLYYRTGADPAPLKAMEDERCLLFPLFATSFILCDYLQEHDFFGADQVLIGSVSSKTGFGLAHLLHHDATVRQRIAGLTSSGNLDFVRRLAVCDQVVSYDALAELDPAVSTALVDMSGSGAMIARVHQHFGDNIKESCLVGATHWEESRKSGSLPGAKPTFFYAPTHIAKRDKEWGAGAVALKAFAASANIAASIKGQLEIVHARGPEAVSASFHALLDNQVPPSRGLMLSLL